MNRQTKKPISKKSVQPRKNPGSGAPGLGKVKTPGESRPLKYHGRSGEEAASRSGKKNSGLESEFKVEGVGLFSKKTFHKKEKGKPQAFVNHYYTTERGKIVEISEAKFFTLKNIQKKRQEACKKPAPDKVLVYGVPSEVKLEMFEIDITKQLELMGVDIPGNLQISISVPVTSKEQVFLNAKNQIG